MNKSRVIKIVLCGNVNTGKTCLVRRFVDGDYSDNKTLTVGVNFVLREMKASVLTVHCWDVSGDDRHKHMVRPYMAGAQVVMFAFDLCNRDSFECVESVWRPLVCGETSFILLYLVGTKLDMADAARRQVTSQEALLYATAHGMRYFEASSKTGGADVEQNFQAVVQLLSTDVVERAPVEMTEDEIEDYSVDALVEQPRTTNTGCGGCC
jgi:small GTP-binding protein